MEALSATRGQAVLWMRCHLALQTNTFVVRDSRSWREGRGVRSILQEGRRFLFLPYVFGNHAAHNQYDKLPPLDVILHRMSALSEVQLQFNPPPPLRTEPKSVPQLTTVILINGEDAAAFEPTVSPVALGSSAHKCHFWQFIGDMILPHYPHKNHKFRELKNLDMKLLFMNK